MDGRNDSLWTEPSRSSFEWHDYTFFCTLLAVSVMIGIYFGFFSKQDSTAEYLLGGRRMGCVPVATSIIASHVSGITLLGIPAEVYRFGSQYCGCWITSIATALITVYVFLPVFYKLQLTSTFEYLEIRFSRPVRTLCSFLFVVSLFMYIPIVIYVPALAFSQVTDFSIHAVTPILCGVCILYTTIGGLKAVVWTDAIQFSVTVGSLFAVLFLGVRSVSGFSEVWRIADEGGRLIFFNMDPSPFARNTFWGMSIGATVMWIGHFGVHQGTVQRFLSLPTQKDASHAMAITAAGLIVVKFVSVFTGLIMYAKYHDCDPLLRKAIKRSDQTLPYYVMDVAGHIPGLPGLFLAGLVSASLATMSASLNTMAGILYKDFIECWMPESENGEARAATIMKWLVVIGGMISIGLVFLIEHLGSIFQLSFSTRGITDGPLLGLFVLGILVPWSNTQGAVIGGCAGLISMSIIVGGTQYYVASGLMPEDPLPVSVEGCPFPLNETFTLAAIPEEIPYVPGIFRISFIYYTALGCFVVVAVGTASSFLFGEVDLEKVDPDQVAPFLRRILPARKYAGVSTTEFNCKPMSYEDAIGLKKDQHDSPTGVNGDVRA